MVADNTSVIHITFQKHHVPSSRPGSQGHCAVDGPKVPIVHQRLETIASSNAAASLATQRDALQQLGSFLRHGRMESRCSKEHHARIVDLLTRYPALATCRLGSRRWDRALPLFHMVGAQGVSWTETLAPILQKNPLALEESGQREHYLPLHYACDVQADAHVIQWLIQHHPAAVATPCEEKGRLPLHYAVLKYHTSHETLRHLVDQDPTCLLQRDHQGCTALDLAVHQSCHPALVDHLLGLLRFRYPHEPLELKLLARGDVYQVDPSILRSCLDRTLPYATSVVWTMEEWDHEKRHHMDTIMQCLQHQQQHSAFHSQTGTRQTRKEKQSLRVVTPRDDFDPEVWNTVANLVSTGMDAISHLHLGPSLHGCRSHWIQHEQIRKGCASHLESLELEQFALSSGSLADLLCRTGENHPGGRSSLRELTLTLVSLEDERGFPSPDWSLQRHCDFWTTPGTITVNPWRQSRLEKLVLWNCLIEEQHVLRRLLQEIIHMPRLTALEIVFRSHVHPTTFDSDEEEARYWNLYTARSQPMYYEIEAANVTPEIVAILQRGKLRALTVEGPCVDVEPIGEVLSSPVQVDTGDAPGSNPLQKLCLPSSLDRVTQLKTFAKLFPGNLTLQHVGLNPPSGTGHAQHDKTAQQIVYHVALNRYGRQHLVEGWHLSLSAFADLLASAETVDVYLCPPPVDQTSESTTTATSQPLPRMVVDIFQIQYGLLRFAPGLWSSGLAQASPWHGTNGSANGHPFLPATIVSDASG